MALTCPIGFDVDTMRAKVRDVYSRVALEPDSGFHFHCGPRFAAEVLDYDPEALRSLPAENTRSFAGVGNPLAVAPLFPGEIVLDIGCGAGTDLLLAAQRVAPTGRAIGIDLNPDMRALASQGATTMGLASVVEIHEGQAEDLPLASGSVDVVISNGVLNLAADKVRAFEEIARVLRPGGRVQIADVVLARDLSLDAREDIDLWAA